jgi:8-oxo-dGTP diphosphatase
VKPREDIVSSVWLEGELLLVGPPVVADVVVWRTPWPRPDPSSIDPSRRVLVVPSCEPRKRSRGRRAARPPYAALVVGAAPARWTGAGLTGPVVRLDADLFRTGDQARVEGTTARLELMDLEEVRVVTAFLQGVDGRILLLRRSAQVGSFQGRWAGVSGFLEAETAEAQAYTEIREETGLRPEQLKLERVGRLVYARDGRRVFVVHPFRFRVRSTRVQLDWEHTEAEWVDPAELRRRLVVPKLDQVWATVRPEGNE